jgi:hypothetical protein
MVFYDILPLKEFPMIRRQSPPEEIEEEKKLEEVKEFKPEEIVEKNTDEQE